MNNKLLTSSLANDIRVSILDRRVGLSKEAIHAMSPFQFSIAIAVLLICKYPYSSIARMTDH